MKSIYLILTLLFVFNISLFSQKKNLGTWTIGAGLSNFNMHGDLNSDSPNIGFYISLNKMISPAFGFEVKGQILNMEGSSNGFSDEFPILHTTSNTDNLNFVGDSFGGELDLVIDYSGFSSNPNSKRKLNFASYFGIGFHSYTTKLFDANTNEVLINFTSLELEEGGGETKSIYYTSGLGLKYRVSKRMKLELRQSLSLNNEDHLDATISDKQNLEIFYTTQLGFIININKEYRKKTAKEIEQLKKDISKAIVEKLDANLIDTDGDGVFDQFDKESNTHKHASVYANGVTIDSDKDGVPDYLDKCPLITGYGEDGCIKAKKIEEGTLFLVNLADVEKKEEKKEGKKEEEKEEGKEEKKEEEKEEGKEEKKEEKKENEKEDEKVEIVSSNKKLNAFSSVEHKQERMLIEAIIANAKKGTTEEIIVTPKKIDPTILNHPNFEAIKELNKNNIKHNIPELDNSVTLSDIDKAPVYPGCEELEDEDEKRNCLINKISSFTLENFDSSQFSDLNLNEGTNLVRVIFVINSNGKSKAYRIMGKWDSKVKKEARRVIDLLPIFKPGLLDDIPTPVKFSIEIPFIAK